MRRLIRSVPLTAALAWPAVAQPALLGSETVNDVLVRVDPLTAMTTVIGPLNDDIVSALAYDGNHNILYGYSNRTNRLLLVDPVTGNTTPIGPSGIAVVHGLAYDSRRNTLFGVTSFGDNSLYRFNVATGAATLIAPHGKPGLQGIAYNRTSDVMWAAETQEKRLFRLDTSTGGLTLIGPFNSPSNVSIGNSLAWDPAIGLFATDNKFSPDVDDQLFRIDPATGQATLVGNLNTADCLGLEFVPCYADCETGPGRRVLDIFDFLCFQNRYAAGASYACNCDTSTGVRICDIFDFICFQNAFAAGCP